jgi:hypothetical protein
VCVCGVCVVFEFFFVGITEFCNMIPWGLVNVSNGGHVTSICNAKIFPLQH